MSKKFVTSRYSLLSSIGRASGNYTIIRTDPFPRFTRTALDVGGPGVEAFGMISESCAALIVAGREVT
jgi:hypothetical protein